MRRRAVGILVAVLVVLAYAIVLLRGEIAPLISHFGPIA